MLHKLKLIDVTWPPLVLDLDLHDVCKRASARLNIQWPVVQEETLRSRYDRKKLSQVKRARKQLLPVFLELLEELAISWRNEPYNKKRLVVDSSVLDCEGMKDTAYAVCPRWSLWWVRTSIHGCFARTSSVGGHLQHHQPLPSTS